MREDASKPLNYDELRHVFFQCCCVTQERQVLTGSEEMSGPGLIVATKPTRATSPWKAASRHVNVKAVS